MIKSLMLSFPLLLFLFGYLNGESCDLAQLRSVRLDGPGFAGGVEVCWRTMETKTEWKPVCYSEVYSEQNAELLCRHLGYPNEGYRCVQFPEASQCLEIHCVLSNASYPRECFQRAREYQQATGVICNPTRFTTTTENFQVPTSSSDESETLSKCRNSGAAVGGVLGVLIVILVLVVLGISLGWIYKQRSSKHQKTIVQPTSSQFINPSYDAVARSTIASLSYQQTTSQQQSGTNGATRKENTTGHLYQEPQRQAVLQEHVYQVVQQQQAHPYHELEREGDGQDYSVISEDITDHSNNKMEGGNKDVQETIHTYSTVTKQHYEILEQATIMKK